MGITDEWTARKHGSQSSDVCEALRWAEEFTMLQDNSA